MNSNVTEVTAQGAREYQEDFSVTKHFDTASFKGWFLAVMDGHGGNRAAKLCTEKIIDLFDPNGSDFLFALKSLCVKLNDLTINLEEGSTLSIAIIDENKSETHIAIIGDSPVVVYDGKTIQMGPEHNVRSNIKERKLAEERGGIYSNGYLYDSHRNRGLQMSRSLGDSYLGSVLSREPEIYTVSNPQWILVASDGLLDPGHGNIDGLLEEIKGCAAKKLEAQDLLKWAETRGLQDNATAIVWSLK